MAFHDPIADFLTRIRNALVQKHRHVDMPMSKQKLSIAKLLEEHGFIDKVIINDDKRKMRLFLKYTKTRDAVIKGLQRVSSPGRRRYISCREIPEVLGGIGISVLSTPKGIVDGEKAKNEKLGGELLCYIW